MRSHILWGLSALLVIGAGFAAQARNLNLLCDLPAAHGELNGNSADIPARQWDLTICQGCRVAFMRADEEASYAKNHAKPAVWRITSTQYIAEQDSINQNGVLVGHSSWVVHRTNATLEVTFA